MVEDANPTCNVPVLPRVYLNRIIDIDRFSSIGKLLRVTAYVLRFFTRKTRNKEYDGLSIAELELPRMKWIQTEQLLQKANEGKDFFEN